MSTLVNILYSIFRVLFRRKDKVAFLSRQGSHSLDFAMLEQALMPKLPGWRCSHVCRLAANTLDLGLMTIHQVYEVATSRICIVDGYVPAVSLPKKETMPCVVQLWHALGAIKKFGYQSLDTAAGHSSAVAERMSMHKNYDHIIAGGPGMVDAFIEAFGYANTPDVVAPLGIPRIDYLLDPDPQSDRRSKLDALLADSEVARGIDEFRQGGGRVILYAPTFRKNPANENWLSDILKGFGESFDASDYRVLVTGHPLEKGRIAEACAECDSLATVDGASSIDLIELADVVVSDYSAFAFEAGVLGKPVYFLVPDIDEYRVSPGLNIDLEDTLPFACFRSVDALKDGIISKWSGNASGNDFTKFADEYLGHPSYGVTEALAATVAEWAVA